MLRDRRQQAAGGPAACYDRVDPGPSGLVQSPLAKVEEQRQAKGEIDRQVRNDRRPQVPDSDPPAFEEHEGPQHQRRHDDVPGEEAADATASERASSTVTRSESWFANARSGAIAGAPARRLPEEDRDGWYTHIGRRIAWQRLVSQHIARRRLATQRTGEARGHCSGR